MPAHSRRNMKKGPTEVGPLQVQLRRISAQPHRCNGKSFQYPPNVIILLIIYFLWVCYSVVLVLEHYARFIGLRKSTRPPIGRCSHFFHFVRRTPRTQHENEPYCPLRTTVCSFEHRSRRVVTVSPSDADASRRAPRTSGDDPAIHAAALPIAPPSRVPGKVCATNNGIFRRSQ